MSKKIMSELVAIPIILLFLYTGLNKFYHFQNFRLQLRMSPWTLLSSVSGFMAWLLPALEIFIAIILLWPPLKKAGFALASILFLIFISYIVILLGSGKKLPCSCGGIVSYLSWNAHLILNTIFFFLSIVGVFIERRLHVTSPITLQ